jgi:hypothetical protein
MEPFSSLLNFNQNAFRRLIGWHAKVSVPVASNKSHRENPRCLATPKRYVAMRPRVCAPAALTPRKFWHGDEEKSTCCYPEWTPGRSYSWQCASGSVASGAIKPWSPLQPNLLDFRIVERWNRQTAGEGDRNTCNFPIRSSPVPRLPMRVCFY